MRAFEVLATGPLTTVQDRGRPGWRALGVSPSGAADRTSHALGQRLLANPPDAAALEVTAGGLRLRALAPVWVGVTGAFGAITVTSPPQPTVERPRPWAAPFPLAPGEELSIRMPDAGLRSYLSVRGGFAVDPVLGSRSTDTLSGLGPEPLSLGQILQTADVLRPHDWPPVDQAPVSPPAGPGDIVALRVLPGPRRDWFIDPASIGGQPWAVDAASDRRGVRLGRAAPVLRRHRAWEGAELASEGLMRGAVQVTPSGALVVFLADHPVTGGYPVIGVLPEADTDRAAQLVPGQLVTLVPVAPG